MLREGDLIKLVDYDYDPVRHAGRMYTLGNLNMDNAGFQVPMETIGVVVKVVMRPPGYEHDSDNSFAHVMVEVGGEARVGWAYIDECVAVTDD